MIVKRPDNFFPDLRGYVDKIQDAKEKLLSKIFARSAPIAGDPNVADEHGRTPLFVAVENNQSGMIKTLLEERADPNKADENRLTPIFKAVFMSNIEAIKVLNKYGADLNRAGNYGLTPLFLAVETGNEEVKTLLEEGADPNKTNEDGLSPIFVAVYKNNLEMIETLLEYGANPDLEDIFGDTPRSKASEEARKIFEEFDELKLLLRLS